MKKSIKGIKNYRLQYSNMKRDWNKFEVASVVIEPSIKVKKIRISCL